MSGVSVVIPCYNGAGFLREALESAVSQTQPPREVIVVDDGSTDESAEVAATFGDPVRVIRQANQGKSAARNTGIRAASGDLIAFLDADDIWMPHKLERQVRALANDAGSVLVHSRAEVFDTRSGLVRPFAITPDELNGSCLVPLIEDNRICTSSVLVRRDALEEIGAFRCVAPLSIAQDYDVWLRLAPRHRFLFLDDLHVRYRVHGANTSHNAEKAALAVIFALKSVWESGEASRPAEKSAIKSKISEKYFDIGYGARDRGDFSKAGPWLRRAWLWNPTNRSKAALASLSTLPAVVQSAVRSAKQGLAAKPIRRVRDEAR